MRRRRERDPGCTKKGLFREKEGKRRERGGRGRATNIPFPSKTRYQKSTAAIYQRINRMSGTRSTSVSREKYDVVIGVEKTIFCIFLPPPPVALRFYGGKEMEIWQKKGEEGEEGAPDMRGGDFCRYTLLFPSPTFLFSFSFFSSANELPFPVQCVCSPSLPLFFSPPPKKGEKNAAVAKKEGAPFPLLFLPSVVCVWERERGFDRNGGRRRVGRRKQEGWRLEKTLICRT